MHMSIVKPLQRDTKYTINYNYKRQLRHAFMRILHLFIMYLNLIIYY